jgi:hypothetical protein
MLSSALSCTKTTYEELYLARRLSVRQVASVLAVSATKARKDMVRFGVQRRAQSPHSALRRDFFDNIATAEQAYVLGLLWADGTLDTGTQQVRLRLEASDRPLLETIRALLNAAPLSTIAPSGNAKSPQVGLILSSKRMVDALLRLGLTEAKDQTLPTAVAPPAQLIGDFVRGLIDGDGCLKFVGEGRTPRIEFRNRNDSLRSIVSNYWFELTGERAHEVRCVDSRTGRVYPSIYLSGAASVSAARVMYTNATLALPRKAALAQRFVSREVRQAA